MLENLCVHFRTGSGLVKAVDGVNLQLRRGEILGVVGESGAGKTVMGLSILGLLHVGGYIAGGRILFEGTDLASLPEARLRALRGERIAIIFQDPMMTLNPVLRIDTHMIETVRTHHPEVGRSEARQRAIEALTQMGMPSPEHVLKAYPHEFSGGMRQRLVIAMALLNSPSLLIADEPTTALDVTTQAQILHEIQKLCRLRGTAILWITHDLSVAAGLADEIAVMYAGKIVEQGPVEAVLDRPLHPFTRGLIGSIPSQTPRGLALQQIPGMTPAPLVVPDGCGFRSRCTRASVRCLEVPALEPFESRHFVRCFHPHTAAPP